MNESVPLSETVIKIPNINRSTFKRLLKKYKSVWQQSKFICKILSVYLFIYLFIFKLFTSFSRLLIKANFIDVGELEIRMAMPLSFH